MVARPLRTGRSSRSAKIRSILLVTFFYESRATDAEKHRAADLIQALALKSRLNPDRTASSVVDLECPPLRSREARSNDMDSLERR